jgi:glycerate kinase
MKIICAPDSFKESISAPDAAAAMAAGIRQVFPDVYIDRCPIGDGGEGTLLSLLESVSGDTIKTKAANVFGEPIDTTIALLEGGATVFVESAESIGLSLINVAQRDIMRSSSFGVGEMIASACEQSPARVIVGVGGSATNDGGCGMAQALGVDFYDQNGNLMRAPITAGMLGEIARIDAANRLPNLDTISMQVACDVVNPFFGPNGAATVYAPQKGATAKQATQLDDELNRLSQLIKRDLNCDLGTIAGAGAGGGLAGGLVAFAKAKASSGIDIVLEAIQFESRIRDADLCLTGEGSLDAQSGSGKACSGVARLASHHSVPVVALVGRVSSDFAQAIFPGLTEHQLIGADLPVETSMREAAALLAGAAAAAVARYKRP